MIDPLVNQGAHGVEEPAEASEVGTSFEVLVLLPGAHEDEDGNDLVEVAVQNPWEESLLQI